MFFMIFHQNHLQQLSGSNLSDRTIMVKSAMPESRDFDIVVSTEKFDLIGMAEDE